MSHPVWVRGLKLQSEKGIECHTYVAPRVGAWIETGIWKTYQFIGKVAPRVGAWIETMYRNRYYTIEKVAPRVGAWIETFPPLPLPRPLRRRTPCGCVD